MFYDLFSVNVSVVYAIYGGTESSQIYKKKIFICVLKMNESLKGLEQHEGE